MAARGGAVAQVGADSPQRPRQRFAHRRWLWVLIVASALPLLVNLALTVTATHLVSSQSERLSYASQAYFDTRYYDEVLTMSANMAATTGDPYWTQRYRRAQAELAASLDVALTKTSGVELSDLVLTSSANDALLALEDKALSAVARGDLVAAQNIMASPEYAALKAEYSDSVAQAEAAFRLQAERDVSTWTRLLALQFVMLALSMAWLMTVSVLLLRAWRREAAAEIGDLHADLVQSDERFRRAMQESAIGMCIANRDGDFIEVNPALCNYFGYPESELLATTWQDLTWPDDLDRDLEQVARVVTGEIDHFSLRKRYLHRTGRMLIGELVVSGIRDDAGELAYFLAQIVDVTARTEAEAAQIDSERRYRLLAENATDLVFRTTPDGIVTWVSPALTDALGWHPADVLDGRICDLVHPEDRHSAWGTMCAGGAAEANDEQPDSSDTALVRMLLAPGLPTGGFRWVSVRVTRIVDPQGHPEALVLGVRDVDDLVRTRSEMAVVRRAEERLRLYMESAAVGMAIASRDGHLVSVNPALANLLNYAAADLNGRSLIDLTHPEDRAGIAKSLAVVSEGDVTNVTNRQRLQTHDGGFLWVDLSLAPVRYPDGSLRHFVAQVVDVSAEVANFEALQRNAAHYRILAENASDVVYQTDMHGTIRWISPSVHTVLGWTPDTLIGTKSMSLVDPADVSFAERSKQAAYLGSPLTNMVLRFRRINGASRYMSMSARPFFGADGQQSGVIVSLRDVTEEHAAAEELRMSEERFRLAIDGAPQGVGLADAAGRFIEVNPALCALVGRTESNLLTCAVTDLFPEAECAESAAQSAGAASGDRHRHRIVTATGEIWVDHSVGLLRDDQGEVRFSVHQFTDATAARAREAELQRRATRDSLTGVANRAEVLAQLRDRLSAQRGQADLVGVLFCDVDNLKHINDAFGHACGDAALTATADRLVAAVRGSDTVGRVGGDEFVVVMSHFRKWSDFVRVVGNIQQKASRPVTCGGVVRDVTVSVGATLAGVGSEPEQVLAHADQALYGAKNGGRNRVVFYEEPGANQG